MKRLVEKGYDAKEITEGIRRFKKGGKTKKGNPFIAKSVVVLEEGSNLSEFEKDVNKEISRLGEDREVVEMAFKTGITKDTKGREESWYSMALHHTPRKSYVMKEVFERLGRTEERTIEMEKLLKSIEIHLKENERELERRSKEKAEVKVTRLLKEKKADEQLLKEARKGRK